MPISNGPLRLFLFAFTLCVFAPGCRAQTPDAKGDTLPIQLARRVEVMLRSHANLPPASTVQIGTRMPSEFLGYDQIAVTYSSQGETSKPIKFLLSKDGKKVVQFHEFDISADPRTLVPEEDRPARGGPKTAPVLIVGFDDLECPFCARLNATLFPAILDRYKDRVRIVYRDFPGDEHPWAMRAAIDTSCLGKQNAVGYWTAVDEIHLYAGSLGGPERTLTTANDMIDKLVRSIGQQQKVDMNVLNICIEKQDPTAVNLSRREGEAIGVEATPTLFINGAKVDGAVPQKFIFEMIDNALIAQGETPPVQTSQQK